MFIGRSGFRVPELDARRRGLRVLSGYESVPGGANLGLRVDVAVAAQLVENVAVARERQAFVVAELAGHGYYRVYMRYYWFADSLASGGSLEGFARIYEQGRARYCRF